MRRFVAVVVVFGALSLMAAPATLPGEGAFLSWGQANGYIKPISHPLSFAINTTFSIGCGFLAAPLGGVGGIVAGAACGAGFGE
ncbi:MAG: hypothetical protein OXH04_01155 [Acidobacteria bacterium]|nr:hypothetical protein [Acidobacteriota bacterium]